MIKVIIKREVLRGILHRLMDYQDTRVNTNCDVELYMTLFMNQLVLGDQEFDSFVDDLYIERPYEATDCLTYALSITHHAVGLFNAIYGNDLMWRVILDEPNLLIGYAYADNHPY